MDTQPNSAVGMRPDGHAPHAVQKPELHPLRRVFREPEFQVVLVGLAVGLGIALLDIGFTAFERVQ